jgi:hypothetical protein
MQAICMHSIVYHLCTLITPLAPQHHVRCRSHRRRCKPELRIIGILVGFDVWQRNVRKHVFLLQGGGRKCNVQENSEGNKPRLNSSLRALQSSTLVKVGGMMMIVMFHVALKAHAAARASCVLCLHAQLPESAPCSRTHQHAHFFKN